MTFLFTLWDLLLMRVKICRTTFTLVTTIDRNWNCFSDNLTFATTDKKGNVQLWHRLENQQTVKLFNDDSWPYLKHKNGEILAWNEQSTRTNEANTIYVLDDAMKIKQRFNNVNGIWAIDFNLKHIVVGHQDGSVQLHNRHNSNRKEVKISFKDLRINLTVVRDHCFRRMGTVFFSWLPLYKLQKGLN